MLISFITPAYNESQNLPVLYARLCNVLETMDVEWEWIVVDDHSRDATFAVLAELAQQDPRVHAVRLARNFGSHTAVTCGMRHAQGDAAVVLAADLQDPPEVLASLLAQWQDGAHVVWAVRAQREGESLSTVGFARLYYWLMRRVVGIQEMAATGADFFLIDRRVIDALQQFNETHVSLFALIAWMGFRQSTITYNKAPRLHGQSGWNLSKKLKLVVDSVTSFSYLPIRVISYLGLIVALLGFVYAILVVGNALLGRPVQGWTSLMVVVLIVGGMQMLMMGVLGEYVWRALDEARRRPRYWEEASTPEHLVGGHSQDMQDAVVSFTTQDARVQVFGD